MNEDLQNGIEPHTRDDSRSTIGYEVDKLWMLLLTADNAVQDVLCAARNYSKSLLLVLGTNHWAGEFH